MDLFVASVLTFVVSLGLTPLMRLTATRIGLVATPRDDRWNHRSTPLLGGVAVYLAFAASFSFFTLNFPLVLV